MLLAVLLLLIHFLRCRTAVTWSWYFFQCRYGEVETIPLAAVILQPQPLLSLLICPPSRARPTEAQTLLLQDCPGGKPGEFETRPSVVSSD